MASTACPEIFVRPVGRPSLPVIARQTMLSSSSQRDPTYLPSARLSRASSSVASHSFNEASVLEAGVGKFGLAWRWSRACSRRDAWAW